MSRAVLVLGVFISLVGCGRSNDVVITDGEGNTVSSSKDGSKVSITDDKGNTSTVETSKDGAVVKGENGKSSYEAGGGVTEADLGLPFYPGATPQTAGAMKVKNEEQSYVSVVISTPDEPAKIAAFNKPKLKNVSDSTSTANGGTMTILGGKLEDGADVALTITRGKEDKATSCSIMVSHKVSKS